MTTCMHCGKPLDEQNPSYLGLLLHKICYQAVGGRTDDLHPRLPAHHSHGSRETDLLAQKVNYEPAKPAPLDTGEMTLNEVLIRLRITRERNQKSIYDYDFSRDGQVIFTGDLKGIWQWLRKQGEIV